MVRLHQSVAVRRDLTELRGPFELSRGEEPRITAERMAEAECWEFWEFWELVPDTGQLTHSPGLARLLGLTAETLLDWQSLTEMVSREDSDVLARAISDCLTTGNSTCEVALRRGDAAIRSIAMEAASVTVRSGQPRRVRGALRDVTAQREAERERSDLASVVGLGFDGPLIGMALIDPDSGCFLRVNDALCALLGRSRDDLLAESIDLVTHPDDRDGDGDLCRAMLNGSVWSGRMEKRYLRRDGEVVWVAVSAAPVHRPDGSVQAVFAQVMDITERKEHEAQLEQNVNDALWLRRIRAAIDEDRLVLYSQPIVDLRTGETVQQELLIRMRGEDGSIIAPGDFLPIAERYGLISEIDRWVIREAVGLAAQGHPTEFNLSAASIGDPDILREFASVIEQTGADPSLLVVEVTETAMMNEGESGRVFAEQVSALGCRLALDDFGTGYASLGYLKRIAAHHLKIDLEFVRDLVRSDTDERLVRGIIHIAREFDQTTIAEGIEDHATLVRLREMGVHFGQGYLFGRPQPAPGFAATISRAVGKPPPHSPDGDPVGLVRAAFAALSACEFDTLMEMCRPDVVLSLSTSEERRKTPYRGHDGLRAYADDVATAGSGLQLTPTAFRLAGQTVIVFGRVDSDSGTRAQTVDVLWVWELRDGLIASVESFQTPRPIPVMGLAGHGMAKPQALPSPGQLATDPAIDPGNSLARLPSAGQGPANSPPVGPQARASDAAAERFTRSFRDALRAGDPHAAAVVIDDALCAGLASAQIHSRVIAPAMWWLGEQWEHGAVTVAQEHLATAVSHHVLTRLYPGLLRQGQRRGDTIVVAAVHGEHHVLGLRMAADVLEGAGFDVRFLGADVPEGSLLAWVSEHRPAAVALGVTMGLGAATLTRQLRTLREYDSELQLIVGGQGVPPALRESPAVFYAADTERLAEYANRAVKARAQGELPRDVVSGGVRFGGGLSVAADLTTGMAARLAQTTAAAADAARGQARRAFALEQIAFRDPLTELWNRRAFDDRFQDLTAGEITRAPTVLMIDVDHFKSINDGFGHEAGDRALIAVAHCITSALRPGDFAARYGGDEFVVLLPDTPAGIAAQIGERIRRAVATGLSDPAVTVSIGISAPDHADRRRATLDVDRALYAAKQQGRNQVVSA